MHYTTPLKWLPGTFRVPEETLHTKILPSGPHFRSKVVLNGALPCHSPVQTDYSSCILRLQPALLDWPYFFPYWCYMTVHISEAFSYNSMVQDLSRNADSR